MKNLIIAFIMLCITLLTNCEKENIDGNTLTREKIIGKWTLVMHSEQIPIGAPEQKHLYNDSSYEFRQDQSITINHSGNLTEDEWSILDDGKLLNIHDQTGIYYKIDKLDKDSLIFYRDFDEGNGPSRRTFYFKK